MPRTSEEGNAENGMPLVGNVDVYRAVAFGVDGVLVESEHLWERMWRRFAVARGQRWTSERTRRMQGMSGPEWADVLVRFDASDDTADVAEREVVDGMIDALNRGEIALLPGTAQLIAETAARAPVELASSAPRHVIDAVLSRNDLRENFAVTLSSAEVARGKPPPDVYIAAAQRLGRPPEWCLAVEDSSNGLRAAVAAGMSVAAYPNRDYPPVRDAVRGVPFTANSLDEARCHLVESLDRPARG